MANCLRMPMASSICCSSSSSPALSHKRRSFGAINSTKIPTPPLNPKDPFLSKLASVAATSPDTLLNRPKDSDKPPFLDIFDSPTVMASAAQLERSVSYNQRRYKIPPPDMPSMLLSNRIVYLGLPLVPLVTEIIIAELFHLQGEDPKQPIYIYINCTGTTRDDGEPVGLEANGFAIYDTMMQMTTEIHTLALGAASGHACLLLSAGTKGKRSMMPNAKALLQQPRVPSTGLMPSSDALIRAKEAMINRDTFVELLAKHTGNSEETVADVMRRPFYMDAITAKEFGVIDKIVGHGQEKIMADVAPPEEWDKNAGIRALDSV